MKITWRKLSFRYYLLLFLICYANSLVITLLDLNVIQIIITTTICLIIGLTLIFIMNKRGLLVVKTKNDGGGS